MIEPLTTAKQSKVTMNLNGEQLSGFQGLQIVKAIDSAGDTFSFSVPWEPSAENKERFRPFQVNVVRIYVDDELFLSGYVELHSFAKSSNQKMLNIQGRSASSMIVDWSAGPPFQMDGASFNNVSRILSQVVYPGFTGGVAYAVPDTARLNTVNIEIGDTVYKILYELGRSNNLWPIPQPGGKVKFARLDSTRASVVDLVKGKSPYMDISSTHDITKRFNEYRVFAVFEGNPTAVEIINDYEALGQGVRGRKIVETEQETADIEQAAKRLRSDSVIDSYSVKMTVEGFKYEKAGAWFLWTPGDIIRVKDEDVFINKLSRFIIQKCTYQLDESGGQRTQIDLTLPEAYDGTEPKELPWDF